ncbi:MAG: hypothetical protein IPG92_00515 [Flavobacteriales bacterium]|nr:hypothetical protein [Flavobacteriales bacterium]
MPRVVDASTHPASHRRDGLRWLTVCLFALLLVIRSSAQSDTTKVYDQLDRWASKHRVLKWLHDAVFVPASETEEESPAVPPQRRRDPNERYRGRWIRNVEVIVLDPFGNDVDDTTARPTSGLERLGNRVHLHTRPYVVRRLLLLKEGERLDPLRVSESERILRNSPVVNDARVLVVPIRNMRDSVDIRVTVLDSWSLEVSGTIDATSVDVQVDERNLLGHGQEVVQRGSYSLNTPAPLWSGEHRIYNIDDTFIGSRIGYSLAPEQDALSVSFDRGFYSPLTRWAGNVSVGRTWLHPLVDSSDASGPLSLDADRDDLDTWLGWSLRAGSVAVPAVQSTSFIVAARYAASWFPSRSAWADALMLYPETRLALASISLSVRQYTTDTYLYRFGLREDVAEGLLLTGTSGGRWGPQGMFEPYVSISATRTRYIGTAGYLSVGAGIGSFLPNGRVSDGLVTMQTRYFSPAFTAGRWRFRQFARLVFAKAISPVLPGGLNVNGQQLLGFEPTLWQGDWKLVLKMETVVYLPYRFIGFRFAPVLVIGAGTLGAEYEPLFRRPIQPAFGLGLLIRNERLLVNTFQVSFAFYPQLVPGAPDLFRWDALESLRLRNPDLASSRPDLLYVP